jgi:hypothetical protein
MIWVKETTSNNTQQLVYLGKIKTIRATEKIKTILCSLWMPGDVGSKVYSIISLESHLSGMIRLIDLQK